MPPSVSVIIASYNAGPFLYRSLRSLSASTVQPFEVIVVDDCSTDDSLTAAQEMGVSVVRTAANGGPAKARNLGAQSASGNILLFIDSDVSVHLDTISLVQGALQDPSLDAVIGAYDDAPDSPEFLSQYRNLMHCF